LRGEVIKTMKTPDWAKIKIMKDEYELKRRMVETLPETIKYRELKLKD
jgi:transcriptional regulator